MSTQSLSFMKSKKILYIAVISLVAAAAVAYLVTNKPAEAVIEVTENFETTVDKNAYSYHGDKATFVQTNTAAEAYEGKRALKIVSTNTGAKIGSTAELTRWMTGIETHTVSPGERVTAKAYLKSKDVKERAVLSVSYFKDKGSGSWGDAWLSTANSLEEISGTTDWKQVTLVSDVPTGAKYARFEFRLFDQGTLWIDNFTVRDTGANLNLGNKGNSSIAVYETPDKVGESFGAQVVLEEKYFIWVNADCKKKLITDGNAVKQKTWSDINAAYKQLKSGSLDCSQVRAYDPKNSPVVIPPVGVNPNPNPNPGPGGVIGTLPPPGGSNSKAIAYTGPTQFNTSVIPEDTLVTTSLHGRFKGRGQQLFTVDCLHSHYKSEDPIVFPGLTGASHQHEFFGDTTLDANSTVESIIGNANNTCEVGADRSAYWTPTALQDGQAIKADNNKFYYKIGKVDPKDIIPMPVGLRMIAGNANATGPQSPQVMYLFATTSEGKHTEPHTQSTHGGNMFTINERENGVRLQIQFPQCWDGKHLWLPNSSHMAYPVGNKCPETHPKAFLQLMFNLGYTNAKGGESFKFTSGQWFTGHADFINGWKPETLERLVETCVRGQRYCGMTKSDGKSCQQRSNLSRSGCIEFRAGEREPRFFGTTF